MPGVRALTRDDLPRLAELHLKGFPGDRSKEAIEDFLADVMFDHPWVDESLPSLGYEGPGGMLIGCVGAMPRPMIMDGSPLRVVISNNFIVDPEGQPGIAAFALMRTLRANGADLIMGEANQTARNICERLGWVTVGARSDRWIRPLRPTALGIALLAGRVLPPGAARLMGPACRVPDALLTRVPGSPLRLATPDREDGPLGVEALLGMIGKTSRSCRLRPCYDERSLTWMLDVLGRTRRPQALRGGMVPGEDGRMAGWYLYYSRPNGVGRVLQLGAEEGQRARVLQHLFHDAWRNDNNAVTGASDPAWVEDLVGASCFFREGQSWLIAYAPDPRTLDAVSSGDAFLTRLESEAWITFAF